MKSNWKAGGGGTGTAAPQQRAVPAAHQMSQSSLSSATNVIGGASTTEKPATGRASQQKTKRGMKKGSVGSNLIPGKTTPSTQMHNSTGAMMMNTHDSNQSSYAMVLSKKYSQPNSVPTSNLSGLKQLKGIEFSQIKAGGISNKNSSVTMITMVQPTPPQRDDSGTQTPSLYHNHSSQSSAYPEEMINDSARADPKQLQAQTYSQGNYFKDQSSPQMTNSKSYQQRIRQLHQTAAQQPQNLTITYEYSNKQQQQPHIQSTVTQQVFVNASLANKVPLPNLASQNYTQPKKSTEVTKIKFSEHSSTTIDLTNEAVSVYGSEQNRVEVNGSQRYQPQAADGGGGTGDPRYRGFHNQELIRQISAQPSAKSLITKQFVPSNNPDRQGTFYQKATPVTGLSKNQNLQFQPKVANATLKNQPILTNHSHLSKMNLGDPELIVTQRENSRQTLCSPSNNLTSQRSPQHSHFLTMSDNRFPPHTMLTVDNRGKQLTPHNQHAMSPQPRRANQDEDPNPKHYESSIVPTEDEYAFQSSTQVKPQIQESQVKQQNTMIVGGSGNEVLLVNHQASVRAQQSNSKPSSYWVQGHVGAFSAQSMIKSGTQSGRQEIVMREMCLQSFRGKDSNSYYKKAFEANPFEIADLTESLNQQQRQQREMNYNSSMQQQLRNFTQRQDADSSVLSPPNNGSIYGNLASINNRGIVGIPKESQLTKKTDNNSQMYQADDVSKVQDTVQETTEFHLQSQPFLQMSGRRPAKSVDRTARGKPITSAEQFSNHYEEEYGNMNNNNHQSYNDPPISSMTAIKNSSRQPLDRSTIQSSIYHTNDGHRSRDTNMYGDQSSQQTLRRGASQVAPAFATQYNQSSLLQKEQKSSFVVVVKEEKKETEEQPQFSLSNLKDSLFSKISNIFGGSQQPREAVASPVQEKKHVPEVIINSKIEKAPKYLCQCGVHQTVPYLCREAFDWYGMYNSRSRTQGTITQNEYAILKRTYKKLLLEPVPKETENQINRDLTRTFPLHDFYKEGSKGIEKMRKILTAFSNYDHQVDYVQGMNFIVGALLYHANEVMSFWLFVSLIEDCELRDVYMTGLPGLFKHSHIIGTLVDRHLPDLASHFEQHTLRVEMYASDWIFALFASVIPLEHVGQFLGKFYRHRWIFFYQLILSVLKFLERELLQEDELWNILNQIKSQTFLNTAAIGGGAEAVKTKVQNATAALNKPLMNEEDDFELLPALNDQDIGGLQNEQIIPKKDSQVLSIFKRIFIRNNLENNQSSGQFFWPDIIEKCMKEWHDKVDETEIIELLKNFDPENNRFLPQLQPPSQ